MPYVFSDAPQRVYWETTRACDLACRHCRAEAESCAAPGELDTAESLALIDRLAATTGPKPHLILTGGDPLKRRDLLELVRHAVFSGLDVSVSPAVTPLLERARLQELKDAGVSAISLSLDGSTAARHDGLRGVRGTFDHTLESLADALAVGLVVQVNTLVTKETLDDLGAVDALVTARGASRWSLFFLVSVGRGRELSPISPEECDTLFAWVRERGKRRDGPIVTTTEAPHFRRELLEALRQGKRPIEGHPATRGFGIRDGNGVMFISYCGEIMPSGFLPITVGHVRRDDPLEIYRKAPLMVTLRDPAAFHGKCGVCEYKAVCGGSRARAYAAWGDPLGEDPLCSYRPRALDDARTAE
jgi:MoaA/NifB/PqqE/SkfB family radical SAM enzyme